MENKIIRFIKNNIISVYFISAFLLSGILFLPYVLFKLDTSGFVLPQLAPGLTAMVALRFIYSKDEVIKLARKLKLWKVEFKWYLVALLVPFVILFMRMVLCGVLTHTSVILFNMTKINLLVYILPGVLIGAIGEEMGWRGFLLPILQSKMNTLNSSVLLGSLWGFYHFPIIIGNGIGIFLVFIINVTLLSIVVTWLYNSTNGSIIITILFHTVINIFAMTIFYSDISIKLYLAQAIATFIVASVILAIYGNKKFLLMVL